MTTGLLFRWQAGAWPKPKNKNFDLWKRFLDGYLKHEVEMLWVKGHAGIEDNERYDQIVNAAIKGSTLGIDTGYVNATSNKPNKQSSAQKKKRSIVQSNSQPPEISTNPPAASGNNPDSAYHYTRYFFCNHCRRLIHDEEAKVFRKPKP